jgi:hypothetical protein
MRTIAEYILVRRQTIAVYVADRPILENCRKAIDNVVQCPDNGGGNNRWSWTHLWLTPPRIEDGAGRTHSQTGSDHSVWS